MSDFDEFERQLNENKQGEGPGAVGWRLASFRARHHFPLLFPPWGRMILQQPPPPSVPRAPRSRDLPFELREGAAGAA